MLVRARDTERAKVSGLMSLLPRRPDDDRLEVNAHAAGGRRPPGYPLLRPTSLGTTHTIALKRAPLSRALTGRVPTVPDAGDNGPQTG